MLGSMKTNSCTAKYFRNTLSQARNQLGTPGGVKSFPKGPKNFITIANSFKLCPAHISRGGEKFCRGASPPWLRACPQLTIQTKTNIDMFFQVRRTRNCSSWFN